MGEAVRIIGSVCKRLIYPAVWLPSTVMSEAAGSNAPLTKIQFQAKPHSGEIFIEKFIWFTFKPRSGDILTSNQINKISPLRGSEILSDYVFYKDFAGTRLTVCLALRESCGLSLRSTLYAHLSITKHCGSAFVLLLTSMRRINLLITAQYADDIFKCGE